MSYPPATKDYAPANRDEFVPRGRPSFAIDSSSTHRDAPQSAGFVLDDLHCKALPVERIPADAVTLEKGEGGPRGGPVGKGQRVRRVRWPLIDSSTPRRLSLVLRRLFHLLGARLPTFSWPPLVPSYSFLYPTLPLIRYFVSCSLFIPLSRRQIAANAESREFLGLHFLSLHFPTVLSRTCTLYTEFRCAPGNR